MCKHFAPHGKQERPGQQAAWKFHRSAVTFNELFKDVDKRMEHAHAVISTLAFQRNVNVLRELGYAFIEPEEGWLACGTVGKGRMAEPETIIDALAKMLKQNPPRDAARVHSS